MKRTYLPLEVEEKKIIARAVAEINFFFLFSSPICRATGEQKRAQSVVTLPVYLNSSRTELLFTVDLEATDVKQAQCFYERGVAILCSYSLG